MGKLTNWLNNEEINKLGRGMIKMSVKTTKIITREQAIDTITNKRIQREIKEIKEALNYLSNKVLEELMDTVYYDSEFENYKIIDREEVVYEKN